MFRSPPPFHARRWEPADVSRWSGLANEARSITNRAGVGRAFQEIMDRARRLLLDADMDAIVGQLHQRRFARAVLKLWYDDSRLAEQTMRQNLVRALIETASPLSRMATITLASIHLKYFDELDGWDEGLFDLVRSSVSASVIQQRPLAGVVDVIETVRAHPQLLVEANAPQKLALHLIKESESLTDFVERAGLLGYDHGRFGQLVRLHYFLERIQRADPSGEHDFLPELTSEMVAKASMSDGRYFGHAAIEALTDKPGQTPGAAWLGAILDIGGDPRLTHAPKWREWWAPVSEAARLRMVGWLSAQDLRLFLMAVEEYGRESGEEKLQRMFPDRKKFLEGLHSQGLVQGTRLILGNNARRSVIRQLGKALKSDIAVLQGDPRKSVIFVDCGNFHLVEGSHDFSLWIYKGLPNKLLTDRRQRVYTLQALRTDIPAAHEKTNRSLNKAHTGIRHHGPWQFKALEFLASWGIALPADKLMSKAAYEAMKRGQGIPIVR